MTPLLQRLMADTGETPLTYEEARSLARHDDADVRAALARRADTMPEVLYFLAEDPDPAVRRAIADNRATPCQANLLLSDDEDPEVRLLLAQKIATLAPCLSENERDRVRCQTYEALARLARDQIPVVRQVVAETLKDVADAPPSVIGRLARDAEIAVAAPVLAFSPVLTDEDLLEVIRTQPGTARLSAIAGRAGLAFPVADALAACDDVEAIAAMLSNHGAQIREETLDALIERAPTVTLWHEPLVHRPRLHAGAAQRLAMFVADTLVEALMLRKDLDPSSAAAVSEVVHRRLRGSGSTRETGRLADFGPDWRRTLRDAHASCLSRRTAHALGQADVAIALSDEDRGRADAVAVLATLANVSPFAVAAAVNAASAKGVVSVAWKAGLSPEFAMILQRQLAHVPPDEILAPTDDGRFPLSEEEMLWQVEMFCDAESETDAHHGAALPRPVHVR
ncbi:hypothetical protein ROR02_11130 [Pararhodospirillum oryzae]|uniref:DUF2336 domain-containing protein n=2 Tax=Pararhodospirillum oryzae TaxID=478448 RepID=A0A512H6B8_9PROT|nr:hypothetical protein ROR02_11130 [Pararhodospirillum oryzae]